jgi:hypothetical protein
MSIVGRENRKEIWMAAEETDIPRRREGYAASNHGKKTE